MNMHNSNMNEPHIFLLNLSQRLDLGILNKHVTLQNLSIYCMWKNIRKQYKNNKLKIIVPTWNDEFELPTILPIDVYINRIKNRLVFKVKDGYKLGLQMPETLKLFGSIKN